MKLEFEVTYEDGTTVHLLQVRPPSDLIIFLIYHSLVQISCVKIHMSLGLMGLEDGPISLLFQPMAKLLGEMLSYCLPILE